MPQIELSTATFGRLQQLAEPFVDTPETVINKLIDAYESRAKAPAAVESQASGTTAKAFNPASPPDLKHTKVLSAKVDGEALEKGANWNGILVAAIRKATATAKAPDDLRRLIIVNFVPGRKDDEGYKYLPEAEISVQGQDANSSWKGAAHIAQRLGFPLEVEFLWREKEGAEHPGEMGRLACGAAG
jgi:hypothetical protein